MAALALGITGILSSGALQAGPNLITDGNFDLCTPGEFFQRDAFLVSDPTTHKVWLDNDWKCANTPAAADPASGNYALYELSGANQQLFQGFPVTYDTCVVPDTKLKLRFNYIAQGTSSVTLKPRIIAYGFGPTGTWSRFAPWAVTGETLLLGATNAGFEIPLQPNWVNYEVEFPINANFAAVAVGFRLGFQGGQGGPGVLQGIDNVELSISYFPAMVNIDPDTLNKKSKGNPVTAYIDVPDCFSVADIDPATVKLTKINGFDITPLLVYQSDVQGYVLMVKFSRPELIAALGSITNQDVTLTVEGALTDGTRFSAEDTIRVIH